MTALAKIKDAGFTLSLTDTGNLKIAPFSKLTPEQHDYLKQRKQEIIEQLKAEAESQPEAVITIYPRYVICYTPNGKGLQVLAKDAEHEAFLLRMNAKPDLTRAQTEWAGQPAAKQVICRDYQHFESFYDHGRASGICKAGVRPSGVAHWHDTPKDCGELEQREAVL